MDGNMGFNFLLIGQRSDLQHMGRAAAEPWNVKDERRSGEERRKPGLLRRFDRTFEPREMPGPCCCET